MKVKGLTVIVQQKNRKTGAEFRIVRLDGEGVSGLTPAVNPSIAINGSIPTKGFAIECLTHGHATTLPGLRDSFYLMSQQMGECPECKALEEVGQRVPGEERKTAVQQLDENGVPIAKPARQKKAAIAAQHGLSENEDGTLSFGEGAGIEITTRSGIEVTQLAADGSETRMRVPANHGRRAARQQAEESETVSSETEPLAVG